MTTGLACRVQGGLPGSLREPWEFRNDSISHRWLYSCIPDLDPTESVSESCLLDTALCVAGCFGARRVFPLSKLLGARCACGRRARLDLALAVACASWCLTLKPPTTVRTVKRDPYQAGEGHADGALPDHTRDSESPPVSGWASSR